MKKVIDRGKRSKTLSEVKPVENISKNLQSFLEISPMQKGLIIYLLKVPWKRDLVPVISNDYFYFYLEVVSSLHFMHHYIIDFDIF